VDRISHVREQQTYSAGGSSPKAAGSSIRYVAKSFGRVLYGYPRVLTDARVMAQGARDRCRRNAGKARYVLESGATLDNRDPTAVAAFLRGCQCMSLPIIEALARPDKPVNMPYARTGGRKFGLPALRRVALINVQSPEAKHPHRIADPSDFAQMS
jgi:hypothetical protein